MEIPPFIEVQQRSTLNPELSLGLDARKQTVPARQPEGDVHRVSLSHRTSGCRFSFGSICFSFLIVSRTHNQNVCVTAKHLREYDVSENPFFTSEVPVTSNCQQCDSLGLQQRGLGELRGDAPRF